MGQLDGYFYIVQLLPEDAPLVLKLGYTRSLKSRMVAYKTVCTAAHILKSWPCPARFERAAIAHIIGDGHGQAIGRETYRVTRIEAVIARGEAFFFLSTEEQEAQALLIGEGKEARRTFAQMVRDAELWKRGQYQPRNQMDRKRMRQYAAMRKD